MEALTCYQQSNSIYTPPPVQQCETLGCRAVVVRLLLPGKLAASPALAAGPELICSGFSRELGQ